GSTITQQLVKNTFLTFDRTWARKVKELVLSFKVEAAYSKDEILGLYLNEIPYGANLYGVEEASWTFFGKPAKYITLAESAYLAALPKAPSKYSPYGSNRDGLEARKNFVLERMKTLGYISKEEYTGAKEEKVLFLNRGLEGLKAPHFTMYVREYLVDTYGEDMVEKGGLKVVTTLNLEWQKKAEEIVKKYAEENEKKFNAKNAGLVAIDPKTGHILTMVGSRDYFDFAREGNFNITTARRQPGSAFKPFVYAALFQKGYTPETALFDVFTEFNSSCAPDGLPSPENPSDVCYHPQNYDEKYRGPVSLREALAQSLNIPSVKVLYLAGMRDTLQTASRVGITTLTDPDRYGLSLVLGGGEVRLLELTGGYTAFANDGMWQSASAIVRVEDAKGNVLEEYQDKKTQVLEPDIARIISSILSDNAARAPLLGPTSPLYFPSRPVAAKTGTTHDSRDAWVIGFTPNVAGG
ncbi:MAG: transglycosylase domain-containing protein, partial [Patescibacteria group bacterium]